MRPSLADGKHQFENRGQTERRAKQQCREHGKSEHQRIAEPQKAPGGSEHGERQRALKNQPSVLRLLPGIGLRGHQHGQPDGFRQACGRCRQRANNADDDAGDPPLAFERQLAGNLRAVEAAQRGSDIG